MPNIGNRDKYHHGHLKQTMIEKGIEYINQHSVETMSFRKIAAMCNVTHSAPYKHFKDKEDYISQINAYVVDKFIEVLSNIVDEHQDSQELMIELGVGYVDFFARNPNYFHIMFQHGNLDYSFLQNDQEQEPGPITPFALYKNAAIRFMKNANIPPEQNKDHLIFMWALVQGIASIFTLKGFEYNDKQKEAVYRMLRIKICFYGKDNIIIN